MKRALLLPGLALLLTTAAGSQVALAQESEHVVKPGETLGGIANRAKVPRILIAEANGLKPPYIVRVGQTLRIPRTRRHTVGKGDTGFGIAYEHAVGWKDIAIANGIDPDAPIRPGQTLLIPTVIAPPSQPSSAAPAAAADPTPAKARLAWPLAGSVRRGFTARGRKNYHDGIDIAVAPGTAVRAAGAGTVLFAGKEKEQFGNLLVIDHGDGWHTAYGFLSRITVAKGEQVNQGERIGLSGSTGRAKGNELHFELRRDNRPADPEPELPERP